MTGAIYHIAFRALWALRREISLLAVLFFAQMLLMTGSEGPTSTVGGLPELLVNAVVTILALPCVIAIYRYVLGLPVGRLRDLIAEAVRRKALTAYNLGFFLVVTLVLQSWSLPPPYFYMVTLPACGLGTWLMTRLTIVGPALAMGGPEETVGKAFRATAGQFWPLFLVGCYGVTVLIVGLFILIIPILALNIWLDAEPEALSSLQYGIVFILFSVSALLLRSVFEAEIYQRLALSTSPHDVR